MLVFVYGTLKRGHYNHKCLRGAEFVDTAQSVESYPMVCVNETYPYLIDKEGEGFRIEGEVFRISQSILRVLDKLEDYPDYYGRREIPVQLDNGEELLAMCYFLNLETQPFDYQNYPFLSCFR